MIKSFVPWYVRVFVKLVLSRLSISYELWSRIGLFRHGAMNDYSYAWGVLKKHSSVLKKTDNWKGLELGPGDGLLSAFLAPAVGASGLTLVDSGDFACKDINEYKEQISKILSVYPSLNVADISKFTDINAALDSVCSKYYVDGVASLRKMKRNSYDLIYSQAVLEHIRFDEFKDVMAECYRLLKPEGVMSHVVDFQDHLGGGLNNLRFSSALWEKKWFSQDGGFYTNRIRLAEMVSIVEQIGFVVEVIEKRSWNRLPISRNSLSNEFKDLSDEDLLVSGAHLLMRCS